MTSRPPIPPLPYPGGCLCGAVRYRLVTPVLSVSACHCSDCRKLTGTANLVLLAAREGFHHDKGAVDRWRKTADSGRLSDIVRCKTCGTRLWHEPLANPALVFIAAGTLDQSDWAVPASHIWIEKARPDSQFHTDALLIEGQPASREALMEAFAKLYQHGDEPDGGN